MHINSKITFPLYRLLYVAVISLMIIYACTSPKDQDNHRNNKKYSIYILGKSDSEYILQTDSLTNGELTPETDGVKTEPGTVHRELIVKNGHYYYLQRKLKKFIKYKNTGKEMETVASLILDDFSIENFYWLSSDTLLLVGLDNKTFSAAKYYKIDTKNFNVIIGGKLPIPEPYGDFESASIGFIQKKENKLIIGYTFHQFIPPATYNSSDTIYIASLNYPELTLSGIEKDIRSAYPGGINTVQPYSFTDEKGDFYFMSCPGIAMGNMVHIPTGIFRIKKEETTLDKNYFFNISASKIRNHAYGLWYLGSGKAIIRTERKDLYKSFNDHHSTSHFEFYLLDLTTQSAEKLNLPLDKGTRRECVIVENGIAYISINSTTEGNYIWRYNIESGSLKKGLKLSGDTDYILRIDKN